jgi:hypothetical protein
MAGWGDAGDAPWGRPPAGGRAAGRAALARSPAIATATRAHAVLRAMLEGFGLTPLLVVNKVPLPLRFTASKL